MRFSQIRSIYPVVTRNVTVSAEDLEGVNPNRWVEVPNDCLKMKLQDISPEAGDIPMTIEWKKSDNTWPISQKKQRRKRLKVGDIVDVKDYQGKWYEALVRYVYPRNSPKAGKCVIHYIGWNVKWDVEIYIADTNRLAKRNTHTTGPYPRY